MHEHVYYDDIAIHIVICTLTLYGDQPPGGGGGSTAMGWGSGDTIHVFSLGLHEGEASCFESLHNRLRLGTAREPSESKPSGLHSVAPHVQVEATRKIRLHHLSALLDAPHLLLERLASTSAQVGCRLGRHLGTLERVHTRTKLDLAEDDLGRALPLVWSTRWRPRGKGS